MAPSVIEISEKQETAPVVPAKAAAHLNEANESKPKVRRIIDEEENTTASVRMPAIV